jgi:hypothetical protein
MLYDKRLSQEVEGEVLGEQYKGYVFKVTGGNDKQGFPMMQGILANTRVRLLLDKRKFLRKILLIFTLFQNLNATDREEMEKEDENLFEVVSSVQILQL